MKKFIIPLLASSVLAGGIALAATAHRDHGPGTPDRDDMQRHHAEMCTDMVAHEAGRMTFLETKLALSPAQAGAFNAWKSVKLSEAKARSAKCSTTAMPDRMERRSPLEHMAREEERLKIRLADLQAERPALTAFYNSLNDTQKREFAQAGPMHGRHGGMMHGMRHGGWMGHGPMGPHDSGPDGPMYDGDGPPPPQGE